MHFINSVKQGDNKIMTECLYTVLPNLICLSVSYRTPPTILDRLLPNLVCNCVPPILSFEKSVLLYNWMNSDYRTDQL